MTVLSRGARARRGGRRPGWILLTVLLILAIGASSALVFTNRVELLKLAVILALWAAVVAAFVSVIYRRQSDADQAKVRDLKLVYDLQLDREISARREYELSVETHLRRELSSELRAQANDEVAALRAELAALRTNLEILFDTDLAHRPAIETDRAYQPRPDRVASSRITSVRDERDDSGFPEPADSPIIDVPEEPLAQQPRRPEDIYRGSHRRAGEETSLIPPVRPGPPPPPVPTPRPAPAPTPQQRPGPRPVNQQVDANVRQRPPQPPESTRPEPAKPPAPEPAKPPAPEPAKPPAPESERRGRHSGGADAETPAGPRGRHWVPASPDSGRRHAPDSEPAPQPVAPEVAAPSAEPSASEPASRHRTPDDEDAGPPTGGQSVAELLARLQANAAPTGGRRRRRED